MKNYIFILFFFLYVQYNIKIIDEHIPLTTFATIILISPNIIPYTDHKICALNSNVYDNHDISSTFFVLIIINNCGIKQIEIKQAPM